MVISCQEASSSSLCQPGGKASANLANLCITLWLGCPTAVVVVVVCILGPENAVMAGPCAALV